MKSYTCAYVKYIHHGQKELIPGMQSWFSIIYHFNRIKKKNQTIAVSAENACDKIQHQPCLKTLKKKKKKRNWGGLPQPVKEHLQKNLQLGFPGGAVVENPPANARDTGSGPGLGRSHMPWSNWAREPQLLSLRIWSLCSATGEAAIVRGPRTAMKSGPAHHN